MDREYYYNSSSKILSYFPCKYTYFEDFNRTHPFEKRIIAIIKEKTSEVTQTVFNNEITINFNTKNISINFSPRSEIFNKISESFIKTMSEEMSRKKFFYFFLDLLTKKFDDFCDFKITYIHGEKKKIMRCYFKNIDILNSEEFVVFYSFEKFTPYDKYIEVINYRKFCKRVGIKPLEKEEEFREGNILRIAHKCLVI